MLQQYINQELPDVPAGLKMSEELEIKLSTYADLQKKQVSSKNASTPKPLAV